MSYYLNSPVARFEWDHRPEYWRAIVVAWVCLWVTIAVGLLYLFAVEFPKHVGFETALLVGIGLLILSVEGLE